VIAPSVKMCAPFELMLTAQDSPAGGLRRNCGHYCGSYGYVGMMRSVRFVKRCIFSVRSFVGPDRGRHSLVSGLRNSLCHVTCTWHRPIGAFQSWSTVHVDGELYLHSRIKNNERFGA
jgi:hypothetical protein